MNTMTLHYKNCGLDNIWLMNGFNVRKTTYGKVTSYTDVDGLYLAITMELCKGKYIITPEMFRFLRKQLNLTQAALGEKLGYADQTIAKWEKGTLNIPIVVAQYLRLLCLTEFSPGLTLNNAIQEPKKGHSDRIVFENIDGEWRIKGSHRETQKPAIEILHDYILDASISGAMKKVRERYEKPRWVKPHQFSFAKKRKSAGFVEVNPSEKITISGSAIQKGTVKYGNEKTYH